MGDASDVNKGIPSSSTLEELNIDNGNLTNYVKLFKRV